MRTRKYIKNKLKSKSKARRRNRGTRQRQQQRQQRGGCVNGQCIVGGNGHPNENANSADSVMKKLGLPMPSM